MLSSFLYVPANVIVETPGMKNEHRGWDMLLGSCIRNRHTAIDARYSQELSWGELRHCTLQTERKRHLISHQHRCRISANFLHHRTRNYVISGREVLRIHFRNRASGAWSLSVRTVLHFSQPHLKRKHYATAKSDCSRNQIQILTKMNFSTELIVCCFMPCIHPPVCCFSHAATLLFR